MSVTNKLFNLSIDSEELLKEETPVESQEYLLKIPKPKRTLFVRGTVLNRVKAPVLKLKKKKKRSKKKRKRNKP